MSQASDKLMQMLQEFTEADNKFERGVSIAGQRARKKLQEIKQLCTERRAEIQTIRKSSDTAPEQAA